MTKKHAVTLEDVRRNPKLLDRFIAQHPSETNPSRFEKLVHVMTKPKTKKLPKVDQA